MNTKQDRTYYEFCSKKYNKNIYFLTMVFLISLLIIVIPRYAFATTLKEGEKFELTILHTNDIHGYLDNLPKYATIIENIRQNSKNTVVLDGGDIFLRGEFESFAGEVEVNILNTIGYDAMVVGNNDFRVPPSGGSAKQSNAQLNKIINLANFPVLLANVTHNDGHFIEGTKPYTIKNINGIKVGIIGVTSLKPQERRWPEVADKIFERGNITVKQMMNELNGKADVVIVLSHAGIVVDTATATIPKVSAVLGADDHYVLKKAMYNTYTAIPGTIAPPITQNGGEKEHYLGRLDLTFKQVDGVLRLVDFKDNLYENLADIQENKTIKEIIESYRKKQQELDGERLKPAA